MTGLSYVMGITGFFIPYFVSYMHRKREKNKTNVGLKLLPLSIFIVGVHSFPCFSNYTIVQAQNGDPCGPFCKDIANNETVAVKWPRESSVAVGFWQIFLRYTLIPGRFSSGIIIYPLIPWISITLFGMVHGYGFSYNPEQAYCSCKIHWYFMFRHVRSCASIRQRWVFGEFKGFATRWSSRRLAYCLSECL